MFNYVASCVNLHYCLYLRSECLYSVTHVERSGSGVELRTLHYENPGSNPDSGVKTLGKCFHSTLLQFTQLNKTEYLAIDSGGYVYEQPSRINCSVWLDASQRTGLSGK